MATVHPRDKSAQPPPARPVHPVLGIYDDALPRVYGYFLARVSGRIPIAEDLTQETFLAAMKSDRLPDNPERLMGWIFGIARHKLIDHYRQQSRDQCAFARPGNPAIDDDDAIDDDVPGLPDLALESFPVRDAVITTLGELPPNQRVALILKYMDGCDTARTAAMLGLSPVATDSLLARARAAFRRHWAHHQEGV